MEKAIKKYWPIFLLPTMAAFMIGFVIPFIEGIYLSFCKFTTIKDAEFVGMSNYIDALKDTTFTGSFRFTALFAIVTLVLINVLAFLIALALTQNIKGTNIFRTVFFMPNLIGGIVLGYVWQLIFDAIFARFGLALKLSETLGFWGLVILICWQQIGYMMIVYFAGDPWRYYGSSNDRWCEPLTEIIPDHDPEYDAIDYNLYIFNNYQFL